MKKIALLLIGVLAVFLIGRLLLTVPAVQDFAMDRATGIMANRASADFAETDSLRAFVCGSASPLGMGQAQACIAVITPEHFYLIDSGAGSTDNINRMGLPTDRLQGLLITHFHSDHIAEIYEVNLASWVQGRSEPLTVFGPTGVDSMIDGINSTYAFDRQYRTEHHSADLLPPALGVLKHQTLLPGVVIEDGVLTITAYVGTHPPIHPAMGYRVDYKGRSIVVSGDSNVTPETVEISQDADLLLHDALSLPIVSTLSNALGEAGRARQSKIVSDVMDYHASTDSLVELGEKSSVDMVAYYHLVPVPPNNLVADVFMRGAPDNFVLAKDLMVFELPVGSDEIIVHDP